MVKPKTVVATMIYIFFLVSCGVIPEKEGSSNNAVSAGWSKDDTLEFKKEKIPADGGRNSISFSKIIRLIKFSSSHLNLSDHSPGSVYGE